MTDSPTLGRHRSHKAPRRRGLIAQRVSSAWMNSDGHRSNILNCKITKIGIGYDPGRVKSQWGPGSWVQDFGRG